MKGKLRAINHVRVYVEDTRLLNQYRAEQNRDQRKGHRLRQPDIIHHLITTHPLYRK